MEKVSIMKVAVGEILSEIVNTQPAPKQQPAPQPAAQTVTKSKTSAKK